MDELRLSSARSTLGMKGLNESQQIKEFAVRLRPSNVRGYSHKTSPILLPKHDLNEDNSNRYRKQTGKAKQVPLQGSTHHLVIQHKVVRNIHICNTLWTELYLYT